jgi:VCBS repeat-containing protein
VANGTSGTNPTGNVLANDSDVDSVANGETKTVTGVIAGSQSSASGSVGTSVTGNYGSITIASDGSYSYTVDNSNPDVQSLRLSGQTLSETFTYEMTDTGGLSALGTVTINIQGANDNPIGIADVGAATEASGYANATAGSNATGNVLANDTDVDSVANGETKTVTGVVAGVASSASGSVGSSVTGDYGAITINADGTFTYIVDEANATVQALRLSSQTITDVFTYTVTDTGGLTSTTQVTITIQGANDAPVSSDDNTIAVEAGGLSNGTAGTSPSGNVLANDSDVDSVANGETKTVTGVAAGAQTNASGSVGSSVTGSYGSITIGANGAYTYTIDDNNVAVQALRLSGQTLSDIFTYTMADTLGLTSTSTITVTIQGTNDTPVTTNDTNTAVEAGGVSNGTSGTNPTGNVLTNDSDVDSVANGETKTVTGVIAGSQSSASGSVGTSVTGNYGSITITSDGSYTYTVDNSNPAVQSLRLTGQTLSETFTYEMTDTGGLSALGTVTINIHGANDNPVGVADAGTATEASGYTNATAGSNATGNVLANDTDVDSVVNGETKTVTGVVAGVASSASGSVGSSVTGDYGAITINADGTFTYIVDEANATVQALRLSSQTITDVFTYTVTDTGGLTSTTQVTITIQGANDAPVSSDDNTIAVEAGGLSNGTAGTSPSGNVLANDSDVDSVANGETKTVTGVAAGAQTNASGSVGSSVTGSYGSITIGANGAYTYTIDDNNVAVQALRLSGQTLSDIFTYTMADTLGLTSTSTITVTIQGTNDTPVTTNDTNTAVEAGGVSNGTSGTNPTGNVLTNDSDVDSVANGETKTVTGVIAGSQSSASGSVGTSVTGNYGSITITSDGSYTYTVDNSNPAVQSLRLTGQTLSETFTYEMTDTGGLSALGTVTINIHGANDNPVGVADAGTATEASGYTNATAGSNATGNVLANDTDVDSVVNGETKTVTGVVAGVASSASGSVGSSVTGNYGAITIDANGSFTYVIDENNATVQSLRLSSQTITDVFTYTVTDTGGLTSTTQVIITVQGANDAPVSSNDTAIAVEAGGLSNSTAGTNPSGNVLTNDTDVDAAANGETKTVIGVAAGAQASAAGSVGSSVSGTYGAITIGADGEYTYSVDNNNLIVQGLRISDQTLMDLFTYTIADSLGLTSTSTLSVTIQGENDTPVTVGDSNVAIEAGGIANSTPGTHPTGNVLSNDTDDDAIANGETQTVIGIAAGSHAGVSGSVGTTVLGNYGSITIATDGTYGYTVDNDGSAIQALRTIGDVLSDLFTYTIQDSAGATSTSTIAITIVGVNDTPHDLATLGLAAIENASVGSIVGAITSSDVDSNDTATYSLLDDANGRFTIDSSTGVIMVADNSQLNYESNTSHSITVLVTDTAGATYNEIFTVHLTDSDEFDVGPVLDVDIMINAIDENVSVGTLVGITASASDLDATQNAITYSLINDDEGRFAIDPVTGVVSVAGAIDREIISAARSIVVRASSIDGSFTEQIFTIAIHDLDEFDITPILDSNSESDAALENQANGTLVGITATAFDQDATNNQIIYQLLDSSSGRFAIDGQTGVISVANSSLLRYELASSYTITVQAVSVDGSMALTSFTIQLTNLNDAPVAVDDTFTTLENSSLTMDVRGNDYELDPNDLFSLASVSIASGLGTAQIIGGQIAYNPESFYDYLSLGESAIITLTYQITDSFGLTDSASIHLTIQGQRDQLSVSISNIEATEDVPFAWPIAIEKVDLTGETLADVIIRGLPTGTLVYDEFGLTRIADSDGTLSLMGLSLPTLHYQLPQNFSGVIDAKVEVFSSLGEQYSQSFDRTVNVLPVVDSGTILAQGGRVDMGRDLTLPVNFSIQDGDGSEIAQLGVRGIPSGMRLTDGVNQFTSENPLEWCSLENWNLTSLRLVTVGGLPGEYTLTYRLRMTEAANNSEAIVESNVKIVVDEVLPLFPSELPIVAPSMPERVVTSGDESNEPGIFVESTNPKLTISMPEKAVLNPENLAAGQRSVDGTGGAFEFGQKTEDDAITIRFAADSTQQSSLRGMETEDWNLNPVNNAVDVEKFATVQESTGVAEEFNRTPTQETLSRVQTDQQVEGIKKMSLYGGLIAVWNFLRSTVSPPEPPIPSDSRFELRNISRMDKREEE